MRGPIEEMQSTTPDQARRFVASLVEMSHPGRPLPNAQLYDPANIAQVREAICIGAGIVAASDKG